ncbi:MAG: rRNA pseudouridine synthase [Euryarchaeota archaeon]|jgi:pseudouridine synthase|nr:rRNA pseudouridine synthase [Euryarchaeota archaeon]MBT3653739.1 rRNA pseudouridine synthase [Euryarchaeota archaeon]MBT3757786.1 rRNA pseudouridine synthase [Euryarchaeota archaeon]MBT4051140.1 rRNA pseudouridine synthase [Euryarchaeota archaeon]MBT4347148.1 rRNA pseudouridine synthase [Euryarchaeota archaeon]
MKIRLHQFLSKCGVFTSKNEVKKSIWDGEILVNGTPVKDIKFQFNPAKKTITFRGTELTLPSINYYFLLHKPAGYICSRLNKQEKQLGKKSVYELFRNHVESTVYESLVTVGRLDEETTGFLLFTTDGKMVSIITNPEMHIQKTYRVITENRITEESMEVIRDGVHISIDDEGFTDSYVTRPAHIRLSKPNIAILTIDEGKKRQIRRMFGTLGNHVIQLHRLSTENMNLADFNLKAGQFCQLSKSEIESLIIS